MDRLDRDLSRYEDRMKQAELANERFVDEIADDIQEINNILCDLRSKALNFEDGYDFSETLIDVLNDEIGIYLGRRK